MKNIFDEEDGSGLLEEFFDLLAEAGIYDLEKGRSISNYGVGGVGITCVEDVAGTRDGAAIRRKTFKLVFQADDSPELAIEYYTEPDGALQSLLGAYYKDGRGNTRPSENSYFSEFVDDLRPVE